ncbi:MAG: hypothetical protein J5993_03670 [Clostridia bacterium]|nr:hypothetical protein [Clostridia bacterium]
MREELYEESAVNAKASGREKLCSLLNVMFIVFGLIALIAAMIFVINLDSVTAQAFEENTPEAIEALNNFVYFFATVILSAAVLATVFFLFRNHPNISYDYSFVSGEFQASRVYNNKRRKFIVSFTNDEILKLGKVGSETYERLKADRNNREVVLTPNKKPMQGKEQYYLYLSTTYGKKIYVLECREKMMVLLLQGAKRGIVEEDFQQ